VEIQIRVYIRDQEGPGRIGNAHHGKPEEYRIPSPKSSFEEL
jgi:hypothetical protein